MKELFISILLLWASVAGAGEITCKGTDIPTKVCDSSGACHDECLTVFTYPYNSTEKIEPAPYMSFGNVGELSWEGGVFRFKGDADESAKIFLDFLQRHMNKIPRNECPPCSTDLLSILDRAREFVNDNEEDLLKGSATVLSVYVPLTRQRSADEDAQAAIDRAERLKRETQLRRDIEAMVRRMR